MVLFERKFPNSKITRYKLRKLYQKYSIKKKVIRHTKLPNQATLINITLQAADFANDVRLAVERNFRVIQLDECYVTKNTIPKFAWSSKRTNI